MSMMISLISVISFFVMAAYMLVWSHFSATRRVALIPLGMTVAEMAMFGLLSGVSNPAVTMLLVAVRLVILTVCALAMRADLLAAKARARARKRFHIEWHNAMEPIHAMRRARAAATIDIAS